MKTSTIHAADLYCGAGGASAGLFAAAEQLNASVRLVAVNHWPVAIETHSANYPGVVHHCEDVAKVSPTDAVPGRRLNLLLAGPECTHHSNARGGKPRDKQSRASAWDIIRWCEELYIENILIENVPEFRSWGPLDEHDKPVKAMKGMFYRQFLTTLRELGYTVEDRILNAAHFGDATTRKRLFIQARRSGRVVWPAPSHHAPGEVDAYPDAKPWVSARQIIDWSLPSQSIYSRKKPLAENTLKRIFAGLEKFSGLPFVLGQQSCAALVQPFLVSYYGCGEGAHSVEEPLDTVTTRDRFGLVEAGILDKGDEIAMLDIRFRMLQPHELAAAHSFPVGYHFAGGREEKVKQVGNSWCVKLATALCKAILSDQSALRMDREEAPLAIAA